MAVTNLHKPQKKHADKIARFALDAIKAAQATLIDESDPQRGTIKLRVGFHSGPVVANVVGTKNPRCALSRFYSRLVFLYCLLSFLTLLFPTRPRLLHRLPLWRHGQHSVTNGKLQRGHEGAHERRRTRRACRGEELAHHHVSRRD